MQTRNVVRIDLTASAKRKIDQLTADFGMTQVSMLSRLIERFAELPKSVQAALLGLLPKELEPDLADLVLRHLRDRKNV